MDHDISCNLVVNFSVNNKVIKKIDIKTYINLNVVTFVRNKKV